MGSVQVKHVKIDMTSTSQKEEFVYMNIKKKVHAKEVGTVGFRMIFLGGTKIQMRVQMK